MSALNEITPQILMRLIGTPACPVLIDVSLDDDFNSDPFLIPAAKRHAHTDLAGLLPTLAGKQVVMICQKRVKNSATAPLPTYVAKISQRRCCLAAMSRGRKPPCPVSPPAPYPGALWVTRHRPKIDRIACPWLIRRFVDPSAQFLYVPATEVDGVAKHFGATPFDIEDGFWSHRGETCTFDTMIAEFGLDHPALAALAAIVRAADTDTHAAPPQAAGLLAISVGLSRMHRDDNAQLEAGMHIYDAFYRWARDGMSEGHDWTPGQSQ